MARLLHCLDVQHVFLPPCLLRHAQRSPCMQGSSKQNDSVADVVLTGHTDIAEFAEGISNAAPLVASGGRDTNVSCWFCSRCKHARLASCLGIYCEGVMYLRAGTHLEPGRPCDNAERCGGHAIYGLPTVEAQSADHAEGAHTLPPTVKLAYVSPWLPSCASEQVPDVHAAGTRVDH